MQAIVQDDYGSPDVLHLVETDKPEVGDDQVLVRVCAASVNPLDWHVIRGLPYLIRLQGGLRKPKTRIRGVDVAGRIEAVGGNVEQFRPGDDVFGACGGAFAEYALAGKDKLVRKPANLTFEQAAAVPIAALTALQGLRDKGQIQPAHHVLVNGASGGVGTFAVQIAKSFGAEVTGVCSTRNVDMVRSIGADHVIDYTEEDFTRSRRYDLILDNAGNHSLSRLRAALTPKGTLIPNSGTSDGRWVGGAGTMVMALALSRFVGHKLRPFIATVKQEDLGVLAQLLEAGDVTPVIDRSYPLGETPDAIRYLEEGHARGKVVITV